MHKFIVTVFFMGSFYPSFSQTLKTIHLERVHDPKKEVEYRIVKVRNSDPDNTQVGTLESNNRVYEFRMKNSKEADIQSFCDKNYKGNPEGLDILIEIKNFGIGSVDGKKNKKDHILVYNCNFYRMVNGREDLLFTFTSNNRIGKSKKIEEHLSHFVTKAVSTSIDNFGKSYKQHPEWKETEGVNLTEQIKMKVHVHENESLGGDTLICKPGTQLSTSDFAGASIEEEKDLAYSKIIMTYVLKGEEENKVLSLNIYPKTYLLRSSSWRKEGVDREKWLPHHQLLFDIAGVYSERMIAKAKTYSFSPGFYKAEMNKIYNEFYTQFIETLDQVEAETFYGSNEEKETEWRNKVNQWMNEL